MNEEDKKFLHKIFALAKLGGLCKTQKEFAGLLEIDPTGLSAAMNGNPRFLTQSLIRKVQAFSDREGLETGTPTLKPGGVYIPPETLALFTNLSETVRLQAELLTRTGMLPVQKNGLRDEI